MVNITYSLLGANGDSIEFNNTDYVLNPGMKGFGISATAVRIQDSAGDGGIFRHSKRNVRLVDLPITVLGLDRADVEAKLRRLARLTQDKAGPTQLVATYDNGDQLSLGVHYTGGAESQWGSNAGGDWCEWVLSFKAPQPFWTSTNSESFTINSGTSGRGLLPQLSKLKVSSSSSLGTIVVSSSADVDVYPIWTVTGPVTDFYVSNGSQSFTLEGTIPAGTTVYVDTENKTVTNSSGANLYSLLGPAPKLFAFSPGFTTVEVLGTSITTSTLIRCDYSLRYEVVH